MGIEKIGIKTDLIPKLCYCTEIIGEVSKEAAEETGLVAGIPVYTGQADHNASCVASGVINEGDIQSNLGNCGNFGVIHKSTEFLFEMLVLGFTVGSKDTYITIPITMTGGMSIRYLHDHFSQMEVETEWTLGVDAHDLLNMEADKIPLGCEGLVVLPFLMDERTPIGDVPAKAGIAEKVVKMYPSCKLREGNGAHPKRSRSSAAWPTRSRSPRSCLRPSIWSFKSSEDPLTP